MLNIPTYWVRPPQTLSAAAGTHRFLWDMHYPNVPGVEAEYPIAAIPHNTAPAPSGPWVMPGQYTVVLTMNGKSYTQPLTVKMDPRVKIAPTALAQQFRQSQQLYNQLLTLAPAVEQAGDLRKQIKELQKQAQGDVLTAVNALDKKLDDVAGGGAPRRAGAGNQPANLGLMRARYLGLLGALQEADVAPTSQASAAVDELAKQLTPLMQSWQQIKSTRPAGAEPAIEKRQPSGVETGQRGNACPRDSLIKGRRLGARNVIWMKEIRAWFHFLALLVALHATVQTAQDAKEQDTDAKNKMCSVEGTVVSAVSGERLKSAIVMLYDTQNVFHGAHALTDERGHFVIKNVPAGSYLFRATKMGYVKQSYHPDPEHPASALELKPGKDVEGVVSRLERAGVILGRVVNESGEPLAHVEMEALVLWNRIMNRRTVPAQQIASVQRVWTDDLGAYRLFGLPPGSYYLQASDSGFLGLTRLPYGSGFNPVTTEGHPPAYFPGVSRLRDAQKIAVRAGRRSVLISLCMRRKLTAFPGRFAAPPASLLFYERS